MHFCLAPLIVLDVPPLGVYSGQNGDFHPLYAKIKWWPLSNMTMVTINMSRKCILTVVCQLVASMSLEILKFNASK